MRKQVIYNQRGGVGLPPSPTFDGDWEQSQAWHQRGRCCDLSGAMTPLFFSFDYFDIGRAKAICAKCPVTAECLRGATRRGEPWGVWGGEWFYNGRIRRGVRPVGRPSAVPFPPVEESPLAPDLVCA